MGLPGHCLCQPHHKPAHDEGKVFLGALAADLLLNFREGDDVDDHPAAVHRQQPGQLQHLVQRLLGGIRGRNKVHHFQLHAPAGNHIGGNGAVQTAGKQAHRPAAHADGQAAGAGDRGRVDIGVLLPDLHINRQIRMVHIRFHVEELPQLTAYILGDLDGVHRELLVRPAALHLEGSGLGKFIRQIGLGGLHNGVHLLGARDGAGHRHDSEHLTGSLEGGLHVAVLGLRLHIDSALANVDLEAAAGLHPAADIAHQLILKAAAVQALQHHLAQL